MRHVCDSRRGWYCNSYLESDDGSVECAYHRFEEEGGTRVPEFVAHPNQIWGSDLALGCATNSGTRVGGKKKF